MLETTNSWLVILFAVAKKALTASIMMYYCLKVLWSNRENLYANSIVDTKE
jgi:hypothetical protein